MWREDRCSDPTTHEWLLGREEKKLPILRGFNQRLSSLDQQEWPSWFYTNPDPSIYTGLPQDPASYIVACSKVYVFCSHTFWPHMMFAHKMRCPECGESGVALDGWNDDFREVTGLSHNCYVKSRRYRHRGCPVAKENGKASSVFTSLNPTFISSLPDEVRVHLELVVCKKSMFNIRLDFCSTKTQVSFSES